VIGLEFGALRADGGVLAGAFRVQKTRGHVLRQCWLVWLLSVGAASVAVTFGLQQELLDETLLAMGVIFAFYAIAAGSIAGRSRDVSTVILAVWGGTFGFWAVHWLGGTTVALHLLAMRDVIGTDLVTSMRVPLSVGGAGAATMAVLYLATGCGRVAANTMGASMLASLAPLLPMPTHHAVAGAAVLWHGAVCFSLCSWAYERMALKGSTLCRGCGEDLAGTSGPVCPGCGTVLRAGEESAGMVGAPAGGRPRY
jgi:hypothetical protein